MNQQKIIMSLLTVLVLAVLGAASIFTVKEWEKVILFKFGEIVKTDYEPGLHFMVPLVNNVRKFDARIQTLDAEPERYLTAEKKNVIVDSFVKWRINNVADFYKAVGGDVSHANSRMAQVIKDGLRGEFGRRTIQEVVSGDRAQIMNVLGVTANQQAAAFGIEVIEVRIMRIDLSEDVSTSVYSRMDAERARVAKELRSRGAEAAERIRADAERQRTVILAEAYRQAEHIRGAGDARASQIYSSAYNLDPEFYSFYRSINTYAASFKGKDDIMVLEPDADYFKYFKDSKGGK
ncbi:MAG: protease modulator HflC [Gammaproteobacteria bacterium]|nr:protease modulator HflC [Gammaproteobacteria bacterium]